MNLAGADPLPAPRFRLRGADNEIHALEDPGGEAGTFLFFYTREEKVCRAAFPYVERLARRAAGTGRVWALTADGQGETLEAADQFQLSFLILLDRRGRVREAFGIGSLPAFVLLDGRGRILQRLEGWDPGRLRPLGERFLEGAGRDPSGLFQESDWLPGA